MSVTRPPGPLWAEYAECPRPGCQVAEGEPCVNLSRARTLHAEDLRPAPTQPHSGRRRSSARPGMRRR